MSQQQPGFSGKLSSTNISRKRKEPTGVDDASQSEEDVRSPDKAYLMCVSCERCKLRKGKCDRARPVCGWRSTNGGVREYKERRKPGLRAGYGRNLEQRLEQVEEKLKTATDLLSLLSQKHKHLQPSSSAVDENKEHAEPSGATKQSHGLTDPQVLRLEGQLEEVDLSIVTTSAQVCHSVASSYEQHGSSKIQSCMMQVLPHAGCS